MQLQSRTDDHEGSANDDGFDLPKAVRRNTVVLAACMGLSWAVVQLVVALSAVVLSRLTGQTSLGGFAPGLYLVSWAVASLLMGRLMDARGRALGLRVGFAIGAAGAAVVYLGTDVGSVPLFLLGLILVGACSGTINLARAGAADMYPPSRRARGISFVLLGAAFGAILSPIAFAPLLTEARSGAGLATPWLVAAALLGAGFVVTFGIRIDPIRISRRMATEGQAASVSGEPPRSLLQLIRLPSVLPALIAAVVSQGVMAALMSVTGLIMVGHGHELSAVALVMSSHFLGMFGLVLVAGQLVDRLGRQRSIVLGLLVLTGGVLLLLAGEGLQTFLPALFVIGLGWNLAYVGSTVVLADATRPLERARLLGFNDFAAINFGALGAAVCALILGSAGLVPLVLTGALLSLLPIAWMIPGRGKAVQPA
ncbi:MAG TPA: MFS transporter [Trueperaceae bacterium]|nr:MFS transporter [Trueperaceae bacterium]